MSTRIRSSLIGGIIFASLASCTGKSPPDTAIPAAIDVGAMPARSVKDDDASHSALIAAAEPFEALTEQAGTAPPVVLDKLIGEARDAAVHASAILGETQRDRLASQLADIATAQKSGDRTAIALASVEGYRTLVEGAPDTGVTPRAVSLLDYAGFRYQTNLAAAPARWSDAEAAVDFADSQWATLRQRISDASLRDQMSSSIADMRKAVEVKDAGLAKSSSTLELDLVDKLEGYFEAK